MLVATMLVELQVAATPECATNDGKIRLDTTERRAHSNSESACGGRERFIWEISTDSRKYPAPRRQISQTWTGGKKP